MSAETKKAILLKRMPIIINNERIIIKKNAKSSEVSLRKMALSKPMQSLYKEEVIYESVKGDFLGDSQVTILNRLNMLTSCSRTIAIYNTTSGTLEKTSDNVTKLIGDKNYGTVLSALCSVLDPELKIRSILALLTVLKRSCNSSCQTEAANKLEDTQNDSYIKKLVESSCQTDESCIEVHKIKQRKRIKRQQLTPYVVKDIPLDKSLKKCIIYPTEENVIQKIEPVSEGVSKLCSSGSKTSDLPDITTLVNEDSNISSGSIGNLSLSSTNIPELLDSETQSILSDIDIKMKQPKEFVVNSTVIETVDGSTIMIPIKPEDEFHIATPEVLKNCTSEERKKLLWHQAFIDWKYCLIRNEDGNLPLHTAVMHNDVDLVRRQCLMLKARNETVDVLAHGNLSALQMSILNNSSPQCTAMLLRHGADPLQTDDEDRTILHLAAEGSPQHLKEIISYCQRNAKNILQENDLWKPTLENKTETEVSEHLLYYMSTRCDSQGYTALMCASRLGQAPGARLLVAAAPCAVNAGSASAGDSALYLAVAAACLDAAARNNKSKVAPNFLETIELLVENGADPSIDNHSGTDVNMLLQEFNNPELSMLIANKLTSVKYFDGEMPSGSKNFDSFMLIKDEQGNVNIDHLKNFGKSEIKQEKVETETPIIPEKPEKKPDRIRNYRDKSKKTDSKIKIIQNSVVTLIKREKDAETKLPVHNLVLPTKSTLGVSAKNPKYTVIDNPGNIILKNMLKNTFKVPKIEGLSHVKILAKTSQQALDNSNKIDVSSSKNSVDTSSVAMKRKIINPIKNVSLNSENSKKVRSSIDK